MSKPANKSDRPKYAITSFSLDSGILGEMIYNKALGVTMLTTYLDGTLKDCLSFKTNNLSYIPYSATNPLLINNVIRFPNKAVEYESTKNLKKQVRAFIRKHIELPEVLEQISVHYVLLTWVFDAFDELPYLRVRGNYGSGKTRFLNVIGALCYKPIKASGASTVAPLFHILNKIGGTLILDEADFRFSSETADITKILNNGNAKGFPVLRCEMNKNKEFHPKTYNVYSPKIIASRKNYQDEALESRCITFDMQFKRNRLDTPLSLPKSFDDDATHLRNKLLMWRFHNFHSKFEPTVLWPAHLSNRLQQIYTPLLSLVDDKRITEQIIEFATHKARQDRTDLGLQTEAEVLRIIKKLSARKKPMKISDIATRFNQEHGALYDRKITPKWIGSIIRNKLRLSTQKQNGTYVVAQTQDWLLEQLYQQFDVE